MRGREGAGRSSRARSSRRSRRAVRTDSSPSASSTLKGLPAPVAAREIAGETTAARAIPLSPRARRARAGSTSWDAAASARGSMPRWKRAQAGERRVALIAGEPGIGKTRLAAELRASTRTPRERSCSTVAATRTSARPSSRGMQALAHYARLADAEDELRAELGGERDRTRCAPRAGAARGACADPSSRSAARARRSSAARLFDAIDALLASASRGARSCARARRPALGRQAARSCCCAHLVRSARPAALLVRRHLPRDRPRAHPPARRAARRPAARAARRARAAARPRRTRTSRRLVARARSTRRRRRSSRRSTPRPTGNPFFVEEVLRHLVETGALRREDGALDEDRRSPSSASPRACARWSAGGSRGSRRLRTRRSAWRAVIGREFDCRDDRGGGRRLGRRAARRARRGGARAAHRRGAGRAGPLRLRARAGAPDALRGARHRAARATALARRRGAGAALRARRRRAALARSRTTSARACSRAIRCARSTRRCAPPRVRGDARRPRGGDRARERALALLDQARLDAPETRFRALALRARAESRLLVPGLRESHAQAEAIARRLGRPDWLARIVYESSLGLETDARADEAKRTRIEDALAGLPQTDGRERCLLLTRLASSLVRSREECEPLADEALAMARRLGDPEVLVRALYAKSMTLVGSPHLAEIEALGCEIEGWPTANRGAGSLGSRAPRPACARCSRRPPGLSRGVRREPPIGSKRAAGCPRTSSTCGGLRTRSRRAASRKREASPLASARAIRSPFQRAPATARAARGSPSWPSSPRLVSRRGGSSRASRPRAVRRERTRRVPRVSLRRDRGARGAQRRRGRTPGARGTRLRRSRGAPAPESGLARGAAPPRGRRALVGDQSAASGSRPSSSTTPASSWSRSRAPTSRAPPTVRSGRRSRRRAASTRRAPCERALALEQGFEASALAARTRYWWARRSPSGSIRRRRAGARAARRVPRGDARLRHGAPRRAG